MRIKRLLDRFGTIDSVFEAALPEIAGCRFLILCWQRGFSPLHQMAPKSSCVRCGWGQHHQLSWGARRFIRRGTYPIAPN